MNEMERKLLEAMAGEGFGDRTTACRALLPVYRAGRRNCRAPLQRAARA